MTDEKQNLLTLLEEKKARLRYNRFSTYFPDEGQYRRELYSKHVKFMNAGGDFLQRAFIAANRTGKTITGAFEMTCHLTGVYPDWWEGRRFKDAISAWAASVNNQTTKDVMQYELLGQIGDFGTGMIPKRILDNSRLVKKAGVADAIETIYLPHVSGNSSRLDFKSYEQGRAAFQGTKKQVIWLDEEPTDRDIFTECLTRTMDRDNPGIIYCTFTPLSGLSTVVRSFLPDGRFPDNGVNELHPYIYVTKVGWDEVPHLNEDQKDQLLDSYAEHERDARSKGLPGLGSGALFAVPEEQVVVEPFDIPKNWPKVYAIEARWDETSVLWAAINPQTDVIYLYSEEVFHKEPISAQYEKIKLRGLDILGVMNSKGDQRTTVDGQHYLELYQALDLYVGLALNPIDSGVLEVQEYLKSGKLKAFANLKNWISQFRMYRRDLKGNIIHLEDTLMDATRYIVTTGSYYAAAPDSSTGRSTSARGKSQITGY